MRHYERQSLLASELTNPAQILVEFRASADFFLRSLSSNTVYRCNTTWYFEAIRLDYAVLEYNGLFRTAGYGPGH